MRIDERAPSIFFSTLVTEDEEAGDPEDTDEESELNKAFVNALFDEIDDLRMRVRTSYPKIFSFIDQIVLAV